MVTFFLSWLFMASIQLAATMSPGPAFVVSLRHIFTYERRVSVLLAVGLALGVAAHVAFVLCGISFLIMKSVFLYQAIKYMGAAYLLYLGYKSLRNWKKVPVPQLPEGSQLEEAPQKTMPVHKAIFTGFLTNLLNPKAVVFFTAVFSQFISLDTSAAVLALYGATSIFIEFAWFSLLAIILTNKSIKEKFMRIIHWVERSCGGLMIVLGVKLALSRS